ncbi:MAG: hypothetical protein RL068_206 [Actinomycetota bacterium]|jgi:hypothetical protein
MDFLFALLMVSGCGSSAGEFSLCDSHHSQSQAPSVVSPGVEPKPKPQRQCRYYANGTIDQPTLSIITAWVDVGSRACIGDEVNQSLITATPARTINEDLSDQFTAKSQKPTAWWNPGDQVEYDEMARFYVTRTTLEVSGELLGKPAQIRFRPISARWEFGDGSGNGFTSDHSFARVGNYRVIAFVTYQVDYKYSGSTWVQNAATWELASNELRVPVVEYPRRTLLVG